MKSLILVTAITAAQSLTAAPIEIAPLSRTTPVDFVKEIEPFLRDNCLSCHCKTTTKGGLNMETPELMIKGGDTGPGIAPGKAAESLLLKAAAHQDDDLKMPPRDNKAKAKNLTPQQLAVFKLWIDQGAKATGKGERTIAWQPVPDSVGAIFATAITADAQFAACARANRIFIYHVPTGKLVANEVAHRDQVNALAFSPDGTLMASGGYREVKLWRRAAIEGKPASQPAAKTEGKISRADGQRTITIEGNVAKLAGADGKLIAELRGNRFANEAAAERDRALQVANGTVAFRTAAVAAAEKAVTAAQDRAKKSAEAVAPKQQDLTAKEKALADAKTAKAALDKILADAEAELKKADAALQDAVAKAAQFSTTTTEALKGTAVVDANKLVTDATAALQAAAKARTDRDQREATRKQTADKVEPSAKALAAAEEAAKQAASAKEAAETEVKLSKTEQEKTAAAVAEAKAAVDTAEAARKRAEEALAAAKTAASAAEQPIRAAAFSPDGAIIATAGDDKLIHTWSADTGALIDVLKGLAAPVAALAFSSAQSAPVAKDATLTSTDTDGISLAWSLAPAWKLAFTLGTDGPGSPFADRVNALAFSPDGKFLAIGGGEPSRGGEIKVWDVASAKMAREFSNLHTDAVLALEYSADGNFLASGAADKVARILDLRSGKVVRSLEGHTHHILGLSWSLDGRTLATAGADGVVKVWDATNGDRKKNIDGYDKEVTAVRFVAASEQVITSSGDNRVRLVALDGKEVRAFPEVADFVQSASVSGDGSTVIAGGQDGVLRVWNVADGKATAAFKK